MAMSVVSECAALAQPALDPARSAIAPRTAAIVIVLIQFPIRTARYTSVCVYSACGRATPHLTTVPAPFVLLLVLLFVLTQIVCNTCYEDDLIVSYHDASGNTHQATYTVR